MRRKKAAADLSAAASVFGGSPGRCYPAGKSMKSSNLCQTAMSVIVGGSAGQLPGRQEYEKVFAFFISMVYRVQEDCVRPEFKL